MGVRTYKYIKEKSEVKPAILGLGVYLGVIFVVVLVSNLWRHILTTRYLFIMLGAFIFWIAYMLSKEDNKVILAIIVAILIIIDIFNITNYINMNYYSKNTSAYEYIKEEVQDSDIFVYTHVGVGGVMAARFPENKQYFLCHSSWDVKEAYKAYSPGLEVRYDNEDGSRDWSFLEDFKGRVWLIDASNMGIYDEFPKENTKVLKDTEKFETKYHNYVYTIKLIEIY